MPYNFKSLADVELLNAMPENANIIVEVDGATRRAPKEDGIGKLVSVEALEEVPEGATVLAEVNGEIKRVPSDGLGGGKALIIKSSDFDNAVAGITTAITDTPAVTFSANMTFDEMMTAFTACELIGGFAFIIPGVDAPPTRAPIVTMEYDVSTYTMPCMVLMVLLDSPVMLYWTADGGISLEAPKQPK